RDGGAGLLLELGRRRVVAQSLADLARLRDAENARDGDRQLRLERRGIVRLVLRLRLVEGGDALKRARVVRLQLEQMFVRLVRLVELPVARVRGRDCAPGLWILRMRLRPFQRVLDGRACRRAAARAEDGEVAAKEVAETGRARADAEEDEACGEDEREEDEDPLGLAPQRSEERRVGKEWRTGR